MITVTIRKTGILRRAWRMSIRGGNNEKLPHAYNERASAIDTAMLMFAGDEPVRLLIENEDGSDVTERRIR